MNDNTRKLYIKKRTFPEWLTLYIFIMPFLLSFFMEFLGFPSIVKYTIDFSWVSLFAILFLRKQFRLKNQIAPFAIFVLLFFLYVSIGYIFHFQSVFYFLWGVRNNFRFYIAFFAFATFFDETDASTCLKIADFLFWINIAVTLVQFFFMGYKQDYLGGIFGVERGCNAFSTILFILVVTKSVLLFMEGKEKAWLCFLKCGLALIISVLAEIKFFFVLFTLILIASMLMTKSSWKKIVLLLIMGGLIVFAQSLLIVIFGEMKALTLENIVNVAFSDNYATDEDLGRFTAIPIISSRFLTDLPGKLFGMGLGNCDTSAFAICNTPFFRMHEYLHYSWFSSAFLFLETGYVGLAINLSFFVICFIFAYKTWKSKKCNTLFCQISMIVAIICVVLTFYNSALRKETAYILFFALALPMISHHRADHLDAFDN